MLRRVSALLAALLLPAVLVSVPSTATASAPTVRAADRPEPPGVRARNVVEFSVLERDVAIVDVYTQSFVERPVFEVQIRRAGVFGARPAWRTRHRTYPARERVVLRLGMRPGTAMCVRARELSPTLQGPASLWSRADCFARPIDDDARVVRRRGSAPVVRNGGFVDRRATVLRDGASLAVAGIPAGSRAGMLVDERVDGDFPEWRIGPGAFNGGGYGGNSSRLAWLARPTRTGGTLEVRSYGPSNPIGGLVVLPRWVR